MKAVIYQQYGNPAVLQLVDRERPVPKDNEVLIKIYATTVTTTECYFRAGKPFITRLFTGLMKPKNKILGEELAGEIAEVGKDVTLFKLGDHVFGTAGPTFGANAEYICVSEDGVLAQKPYTLSYHEAAACVDGFLTAMPFLRDTGQIKSGQRVLINGAAGMVGSAAVQIAKYFGAEVTGVGSSASQAIMKKLGADCAIDYSQEDFTRNGQTYDIIFDAVGKTTFNLCKHSLNKNGVFLEAAVTLSSLPSLIGSSNGKKSKIATTGLRSPAERAKDLQILKKLLEEGKYQALIDRTYPLEEIAKAHAYVDQGHKKGSVVIAVNQSKNIDASSETAKKAAPY
ncbi:NAD(P)-dependent alcohol dehydrogenase [Tunicatimonas pelagia]|uniref:NAD(P)-dependent alcohol dehydrogenase n=1 Tax=Tunicatimonas pelagia TaxID=931531 RepID=UPI0026661C42|nr:NAD(P)-dependent alcohol dehydrogenase [Tunicatimonas pelagia]WKN40963.1 NAD(P)-dependent alcohol dehydrogenase [Tunicatimonas pelagia]